MVMPPLVNYSLQYNNKKTNKLCGRSLVNEVNHVYTGVWPLLWFMFVYTLVHNDVIICAHICCVLWFLHALVHKGIGAR